ncbi:MAG: hypothetical protein ACKV19_19870 [Verrucomicrobiales bacterium]
MTTHLILTIGTGTAGKHSNLVMGLRRTLRLIGPERYWLVPSASPDSVATADLVREGIVGFQWWEDGGLPYRCVAEPDSLADCRKAVREVIDRARVGMGRDGRVVVNPTSGTKQMSVGAALAALDAGVGELVFTVGERADGVVKTGTEVLETFDASGYFAERDRELAVSLAEAGAQAAGARVARRHDSLSDLADTAQCVHEWERQNYGEARRIAARSGAPGLVAVRHGLEQLAKAAKLGAEPNPLVIADLLQTADQLHRRGEFDGALVLGCRALEMGLRCALFGRTGLFDPYSLGRVCSLPISEGIKERCRQNSHDGQRTIVNLNTVAKILQELGEHLGDAFFVDGELQRLVRVRNDLMHQIRAVSEAESQAALQRVKNLLAPLDLPPVPIRPSFT